MQNRAVAVPQPQARGEAVAISIRSRVLELAIPAVGEQFLNLTVGLVDTFLVGHLGAAALAGVGLSNNIVMLATTFFSAVATGTTALVARHTGAREPAQANRIMHQSLVLALILGVVTAIIAFLGADASMVVLGAEPDVVALGGTYLRIIAPTLVAGALMFIGNSSLRGSGDTRTPMQVMAVVNAINIVVAYTFINGLGPFPSLGVAGSALGAASGRTVGCLIVLAVLLRGRMDLRLRLGELRLDRMQLARIINVGLPAGAEMLSMRLGQTIFAATVASLGTAAYAAHSVVMTSESVSFMPGFGFGIAASTLMGQGLGAKDPKRAEDSALMAIRLSIIFMSAMGVLFFMFPSQFMSFFTEDAEVIRLGITPLRIIALGQPLLALAMVVSGSLRGAGDTRAPMVITTLGVWLVRLPVAFILVGMTSLGLPGAWITMILDQGVRSFFYVLRFRSGKWKTIRV